MLTISDRACAFIQTKLAQKPGHVFRITVKKTGCSGYSYAPALTEKTEATDITQTLNGVTMYIDAAWTTVLQDVVIDYTEDDKSGLKQKKLVFINPKETSRCGCGESFHLE